MNNNPIQITILIVAMIALSVITMTVVSSAVPVMADTITESPADVEWYPIHQMDLWVVGSTHIHPEDTWVFRIHGTWNDVCTPQPDGDPEPWTYTDDQGRVTYAYQIYVTIPDGDCYQTPTYYSFDYELSPGPASHNGNNYAAELFYRDRSGEWVLQDWTELGVSSFYCLGCNYAYLPFTATQEAATVDRNESHSDKNRRMNLRQKIR